MYRLTRKRKERRETTLESLLAVVVPLVVAVLFAEEYPSTVRLPANLVALFDPLVEGPSVSTMRSSSRKCRLPPPKLFVQLTAELN